VAAIDYQSLNVDFILISEEKVTLPSGLISDPWVSGLESAIQHFPDSTILVIVRGRKFDSIITKGGNVKIVGFHVFHQPETIIRKIEDRLFGVTLASSILGITFQHHQDLWKRAADIFSSTPEILLGPLSEGDEQVTLVGHPAQSLTACDLAA
jgi:hypothetical protein